VSSDSLANDTECDSEATRVAIYEVIPGFGPQAERIELYGPAERLYAVLDRNREISRLRKMPHAGVQAFVFGEDFRRHSRWEYCATMLFVADRLARVSRPSYDSEFRLRDAKLRSEFAAAQVLAMLSSIGHLPGTYGAEKGVLQWMLASEVRFSDLYDSLRMSDFKRIKALNDLLGVEDYEALHKLLGVQKLDGWAQGDPELQRLLWDFYVPYLLGSSSDARDGRQRNKWKKVRLVYDMVRRVAYMNVDVRHSALPVRFDLDLWLRYLQKHRDIESLSEYTLDSLVTLEHQMFHSLYLRKDARLALAWAASEVFRVLAAQRSRSVALQCIKNWLRESDFRSVLNLDSPPSADSLSSVPHVEFDCNSLHAPNVERPAELELRLRSMDSTVAGATVWEYVPWPHPKVVVPRHAYGTVLLQEPPTAKTLMLLIDTLAARLEPDWATRFPRDRRTTWMEHAMDTKAALSDLYHPLVEQLLSLALKPIQVTLTPWDLAEMFGSTTYELERPVGVVVSREGLSDAALKLLFKEQPMSTRTDSDMLGKLQEYHGLECLWSALGNQTTANSCENHRIRTIVLTSKIQMRGRRHHEFDGGILQFAPSEGALRLYLLETKHGAEREQAEDIIARNAIELGLTILEKDRLGVHTAYLVPVSRGAITLVAPRLVTQERLLEKGSYYR